MTMLRPSIPTRKWKNKNWIAFIRCRMRTDLLQIEQFVVQVGEQGQIFAAATLTWSLMKWFWWESAAPVHPPLTSSRITRRVKLTTCSWWERKSSWGWWECRTKNTFNPNVDRVDALERTMMRVRDCNFGGSEGTSEALRMSDRVPSDRITTNNQQPSHQQTQATSYRSFSRLKQIHVQTAKATLVPLAVVELQKGGAHKPTHDQIVLLSSFHTPRLLHYRLSKCRFWRVH